MSTPGAQDHIVSTFAEQVFVGLEPDDITWVFDGEAEARLKPLLGIAWLEGVAATRRPQDGPTRSNPHRHRLVVEQLPATAPDVRRYQLRWTVLGEPVPFSGLSALASVATTPHGCVVSLVGTAGVPRSVGYAPGITRRPVEAVVRGLLGHLRNVLEHQALAAADDAGTGARPTAKPTG